MTSHSISRVTQANNTSPIQGESSQADTSPSTSRVPPVVNHVHQQALEQRSMKTIALWLGWALICTLILGKLYHQADLSSFLMNDRTMVTWLIIGGFILATLVSFYHALLITLEWFRASRIERMVAKHGLAGLRVMRKPRRDVDRFISSIQAILKRGGHLDLETLVIVEFSAQHRRSQFVSLIGNLLITLGLIGTVLGMTLIMGGLNGAMNALGENQQLMVEKLGDAMSGMGVAFYTTLMGAVLGGILLRVFSWITDTSVHALQDFMLRTCLVYGAAEVVPGPSRDLHVVEADLARVQERVDLVAMACESSGREVEKLVGNMVQLKTISDELVESNSLHHVAVQHAKYWRAIRQARMFGRLFGVDKRHSEDAESN